MKRDMDFVRKVLMTVEASDDSVFDASKLVDGEHNVAFVLHHIELLRDAGYIEAAVSYYKSGGGQALVKRITWEGYEYLDVVRNDTVWNRTKSWVANTVGSTSFELFKMAAVEVTKEMLGFG
ncbi:MAG: DUF2513 domain-containing protein [Actinobacteria bacterium]|nr:DUF2513 domain-containing protein [Actinomycetota bacterium]MCL5887427.1 DUF2513 domain-containing protein [Actinomycetota bacterium]